MGKKRTSTTPDIHHTRQPPHHVRVWCGGCPILLTVWWMSGVVDVWCGGCLVWWMSGVVDVRCGGCPILLMVWWMSSVVDVWCGGCPFLPMVWWMSGVVDVWCGGCLVWWMSVWWMSYNPFQWSGLVTGHLLTKPNWQRCGQCHVVYHMPIRHHFQSNSCGNAASVTVNIFVNYL